MESLGEQEEDEEDEEEEGGGASLKIICISVFAPLSRVAPYQACCLSPPAFVLKQIQAFPEKHGLVRVLPGHFQRMKALGDGDSLLK